ncbi:MAG: hypothetical protein IH831_03360, partial [Planctomycetes bacterium]|nr:hypothetical protein [Planctomycetota bacterium]
FGFFGGADALSLIVLAGLAPLATLNANVVTPFTTFSNAALFMILFVLINLTRNVFAILNHEDIFYGFKESKSRKIIAMFFGFTQGVSAQVTVDDDFNYADQTAFEAAWNPDFGDGNFDLTGFITAGRLVPDPNNPDIIAPNDNPPGIIDQAIAMSTRINENKTSFALVPSATKSVKFGGDLFDDVSGNKKLTVALRNDTFEREFGVFGVNFVELGFWNAATFDPTDPINTPPADPVLDVPATDFAYRVILFGANGGTLVRNPNWQFFPLDSSLDVLGGVDPNSPDPNNPLPGPDGLVSSIDIGQGWHRWEATISETTVELTLDLFRDGVTNLTRDPNSGDILEGVGASGFDSVVTWDITPFDSDPNDGFDYDPFTSLRIGVPSGDGGGVTHAVVDNVKLELIDVGGDDADFNNDNFVDGLDFLTWQQNSGLIGGALNADGDANGDGNVDEADLAIWESQYGGPPPLSAVSSAVPEPTTLFSWITFSLFTLLGCRPCRQTAKNCPG